MARVTAADVARAAAGPMAFFQHPSHMAHDTRCRRLLRRWGWEGYGRYWAVCESLAAEHGHRLPFSTEEDAEMLAEALGLGGAEECGAFVADLVDVGLLRASDGLISSPEVDENAAYFGRQRANGRTGGRPRRKQDAGETTG